MKKKILSGVFALALLTTAGFGVNKSMKSDANLSDLALSNVEALADNEEVYSNEKIWERYYRSDGTGYNCTKTGSETC